MYIEKTPDDGQRNCPKHVEFYSKNKFEKLVRLVGFTIRNYHDARSPDRQILIGLDIALTRTPHSFITHGMINVTKLSKHKLKSIKTEVKEQTSDFLLQGFVLFHV